MDTPTPPSTPQLPSTVAAASCNTQTLNRQEIDRLTTELIASRRETAHWIQRFNEAQRTIADLQAAMERTGAAPAVPPTSASSSAVAAASSVRSSLPTRDHARAAAPAAAPKPVAALHSSKPPTAKRARAEPVLTCAPPPPPPPAAVAAVAAPPPTPQHRAVDKAHGDVGGEPARVHASGSGNDAMRTFFAPVFVPPCLLVPVGAGLGDGTNPELLIRNAALHTACDGVAVGAVDGDGVRDSPDGSPLPLQGALGDLSPYHDADCFEDDFGDLADIHDMDMGFGDFHPACKAKAAVDSDSNRCGGVGGLWCTGGGSDVALRWLLTLVWGCVALLVYCRPAPAAVRTTATTTPASRRRARDAVLVWLFFRTLRVVCRFAHWLGCLMNLDVYDMHITRCFWDHWTPSVCMSRQ